MPVSKYLYGYVRALTAMDPRHVTPAVGIELYQPHEPPESRIKLLTFTDVGGNRELVVLSILRDALIHSLPVRVGYVGADSLDHVVIRSRNFYDEGELQTTRGLIEGISVDEYGIGEENCDVPDIGVVQLRQADTGHSIQLHLNFQRGSSDTKMAEFSLLQYAYEESLQTEITYQEVKLDERFRDALNGRVYPEDILRLIVSVELGDVARGPRIAKKPRGLKEILPKHLPK